MKIKVSMAHNAPWPTIEVDGRLVLANTTTLLQTFFPTATKVRVMGGSGFYCEPKDNASPLLIGIDGSRIISVALLSLQPGISNRRRVERIVAEIQDIWAQWKRLEAAAPFAIEFELK